MSTVDLLWEDYGNTIADNTVISIPNLSEYNTIRFQGSIAPGTWVGQYSIDVSPKLLNGISAVSYVLSSHSPYQTDNSESWRYIQINDSSIKMLEGYIDGNKSENAMKPYRIYGIR